MTPPLATIVEQIRAKQPPAGVSTKIVAVDGPGGAGKTTFADRLARELDGAAVVHTDDFASWDNPSDWWPRLIEEVLEPLARGEGARYRRSRWDEGGPELWRELAPTEHVVLEGVSSSRAAFQPFLTYSVWVETPRAVRLSRGLERDGEEALCRWEQWMAEEDEYMRCERPRERADVVVRGTAG